MVRRLNATAIAILALYLVSISAPIALHGNDEKQTTGRSQTSWSGTILLNDHHTIPVTDELTISACTNVTMSSGVRIYVEGRIIVEGTKSCPVYFDYSGSGDHMGIQFNSSSNGRGSKIDNASIIHSTYGITVYNSDPYLANVTIWNPDDVGVDLFNSATPIIRDLVIDEAGQDWVFPAYWRYGIGLSIGAGSAPNIDGLTIKDTITRGLNMWGNSGGIIRNLTIQNVSGATLAQAAGIWVEDSVPLIEEAVIDKSDHGVIIRHMTDGSLTRAVIRDLEITNSMYRAMILDKDDRTNYTNYQSAIIEGLTVLGTGGPDAKTPGIATAAIEINATGAWIEDAYLDNNDAVGIQLFFVDSTTEFNNITINNSGGSGTGANAAGISVRSSYFAASFNDLEISNSTGPGVYARNGGAIQGSDWYLHNNGMEGFYLERAATIIDGLHVKNNADSGVHIDDARYVYLSNVTSEQNQDAGLEFNRANDIETGSGDVSCLQCTSTNDARGVIVRDSVDLYLRNLQVNNPLLGPAIAVDNSGLNVGVQGGLFHFHNITTSLNSTGPAITIQGAEGVIDGLDMLGLHSGLEWDASHNLERQSILSNANLSGSGCLNLSNHDQLYGEGNIIKNECTGELNFVNVELNWSNFEDEGSHVMNLDSESHLHFNQPVNLNYTIANILGNGWIEEAWDIQVWVINNNSNGVPSATVNLGFDQLETTISNSTNDIGWITFGDLRGKKYFSNGETPYTNVTISCTYDAVTNSSNIILDKNRIVYCHLPLQNQPPFVIWDSPVDQMVYPSQSEVNFNASRSWDLDYDVLTYTWTSSIDGKLTEGQGIQNTTFTVNSQDSVPAISLSDGIHTITLEVCDPTYCETEQRVIELANLPPTIVVEIDPSLSPWGELISPITKPVMFSLNGTYDPEGDELVCSWSWPGNTQLVTNCESGVGLISFANMSQSLFDLTLSVSDGVNQPVDYVLPVELYNEVPVSSFEIFRTGNYSEDIINLTSTSFDPEGDEISYLWESSLDGIISNESSWEGYLSRGNHVITLSVNDGRMEHLNTTSQNSSILRVENSPPKSVISNPISNQTYPSNHKFEFNSSGSGDWDSACTTFPIGIEWHCSNREPATGSEYLIYRWESDKDGILQENGTDWLIFEGYLSSGIHNITLTLSDGINEQTKSAVSIEVVPSAPKLEITSPDFSIGYNSSDDILVDLRNSVDYDGDDFTFTITSSLDGEILTAEDPNKIHVIHLNAGEHELFFTSTDETGLSQTESFSIMVIESDPESVIYSPQNNQYFEPGRIVIFDSEGTIDADNDIVKREWREHISGNTNPVILSNNAVHSMKMEPGTHQISLYVEDRRGGFDETYINITIGSSNPDLSNLSVSPMKVKVGQITLIEIQVELDDPDETTSHLNGTLTKNLQVWNFNLTDEDGDGIWIGQIDISPSENGRAQLRVTAFDGVNIDYMTMDIEFIQEDTENTSIFIAAGFSAFVVVSSLLILLVVRKRKRLADLELIDSWGMFGEDKSILVDEASVEDESHSTDESELL